MSDKPVSTAERVGTILLAATVGAIVTTLVAHPLIESALREMWVESGASPGSVVFKAQEAFIVSGDPDPAALKKLPVTKIHSNG